MEYDLMTELAFFYFSVKNFATVIYQIINICVVSFCFLLPPLVHYLYIRKDASKFWNITERKARGGEVKLKIL